MNVVFISPNFPKNYWKFCKELKNNGVNVFGIGDEPYDDLSWELKDALTEYYKVNTLENYDEVYRAVAFFTFKYGRIDWIESNNEYWLERDAMLRTDFNVTSGFQNKDMKRIKFKSGMKAYYEKAGVPVARYHLVDNIEDTKAFIKEVGYPVIVKPDNGVGANDTFKLKNDEELEQFFAQLPPIQYIMEEFIDGEICSYDAIINSKGVPIFETGNITMTSIMDIVNNGEESYYYIQKHLAEDVRDAGRRTVKAFGVKSRFVHFEFLRLNKYHKAIGKKGQVVALEVNMRPCGGFSPDMMKFANSTNVYKIWADMIVFDKSSIDTVGEHYYCPFGGRRDAHHYVLDHEAIMEKYKDNICMTERMPEVMAPAMGNQIYIARFSKKEDMMAFYADLSKLA